jgi:putative sigma-54 modulation protein
MQCAEITVNYHNHSLVGLGENADLFTAIHAAILKLEKQAIKVRAKWRDTKRAPKRTETEGPGAPTEGTSEPAGEKKIFRINHHQKRKPMTLDEALLEMEKGRDYLVYRDAQTDRVAVLVRRRDGDFDLVEA